MTASTPLDTLIDKSRDARDQAGRLLADERRGEAQSAAQLRALEQYRADYGRQLQDAMNAGIDAARLGDYRRFIRSLDDAIEQARRALAQQGERVAASRDQWQQRQRQLSSYDTLAQRRAAQARHQEQRREQRASDETNNNAVARRPR
ncbi:flagellar export protein FliJ [Alcanivorax marinus]|uniref:Flagellar FliJ protein n=1 Tax=Alloalcanivorax marinus TaxID=1177169 RepID=A0A9Q3YSX1_9GAMM|nr:flagellar export protein FliJ [Alloalcanivorax marinus]MCC4310038.1 flagellar export protein FliJ [Alloalcanivorax marinus]